MGHRAPLDDVLETLAALQELLDEESARALAHTARLAALDVDATFTYARTRAAFSLKLGALCARLAPELAGARAAASDPRLDDGLAAMKKATELLRRRDALNQLLAGRAHACVTGWLRALTGAPAAYDKQGAARGLASIATSRRVA